MNYTADFETTQTIPARVWCWSLTEITDGFNTIDGCTIESFFEEINKKKYNKAKIYFHNLKFDGQFLLWYLMDKLKIPVSDKGEPRIQTLIGNMGQYYQIILVSRNNHKISFLDSLKKIPMSVSAAAKAFNLEESKLKIDYTLDRPEGYQPMPHEIEYTRTDTIIMAKCLYQQFNSGLTKMTIGADALANYKEILGLFRTHFPILDSETDSYIRKAYKGGFVYVQDGIAGKDIGEGQVYDVNSMYPWAMLQPMPWGEPLYFFGAPMLPDDGWRLSVCRYNIDARVKKGFLPTLQVKGSRFLGDREIVKDTGGIIEVTMTNIDFDLLCDHYDIIYCEKIDGYYFRSATGLFDKYVKHWSDVKANSVGGQRTIAKLMLNSLYGKFAKNPDVTGRIPYIDYEKGRLSLAKNNIETAETVYLPVGAFITAYSRNNLIRTAQQCYERFLYCDTDSIHIAGDREVRGIQIHPSLLGAWKHEDSFTKARYLHAKCYIEMIDGKIKATVAGLSKATLNDEYENPVTWENFHTGAIYKKLKQKSVEGGAILYEDYHQLKEVL